MIIERYLNEVATIDPSASVVESQGVWSTWGQLANLSQRIQERMVDAGVPERARVGLLLRNRTPQLAGFLTCILSKRCAVAFNPLLPYQVPARFKFITEIPRTPLLKPSTPELRQLFSDLDSAL